MKWILALFSLVPGWHVNDANLPLPQFEAAHVVPSPPEEMPANPQQRRLPVFFHLRGGPGTNDPGQLFCERCPLSYLAQRAYEVPTKVPDWMYEEEYDLVAKVPYGSTSHQVHLMMQDLLIERFHIAIHHETKPRPGFVLSLGKNPPNLRPAAEPKAGEQPAPLAYSVQGCILHLVGHGATVAQMADVLSQEERSPVIDRTGLAGHYDFDFAWLAVPPSFVEAPCTSGGHRPKAANSPVDAVRHQLGLKVSGRNVPGDSVVVDSALHLPVEN